MNDSDNENLKTESLAWAIWKRVRAVLAVDALPIPEDTLDRLMVVV